MTIEVIYEFTNRSIDVFRLIRRYPKLPLGLGDTRSMVDDARHYEQQIREAVHVDDEDRVDGPAAERDDATLSATAHRPCEVQRRACRSPAGKNELAQPRQRRLELIDGLFESFDVRGANHRFLDSCRNPCGRVGQPC